MSKTQTLPAFWTDSTAAILMQRNEIGEAQKGYDETGLVHTLL